MPDQLLDEKQLKQLDGNIKQMISSGASQDDVMKYATDFKNMFSVKKKEISGVESSPTLSKLPSKSYLEQGLEYAQEGYKTPISKTPISENKGTEQGWLLNTVSSLDKGFAKNLVSSPVKGLGELLQGATKKAIGGTGQGYVSDALIKFGDYFDKTIDEVTPQDEAYKNSLSDQFAQAFGQVASLIATGGMTGAVGKAGQAAEMAAQLAPKGAGAVTALKTLGSELSAPTAISAGLAMGQSEFDRAKQAGATDDQAFEAFYKNAAVGSVLETIPVMQFFKRFEKASAGGVANYLKTKGVAGLTGGIEEMTTEVMQQLYSNKTAKDIYNINQDIFDGVGSSGGVGFGVGFLLNAMGANAKILKKQGKQADAKVIENQIKQFEAKLENPASKKVLAVQIANQGDAQNAIVNLNQDLANNVISPEEHQDAINFAEKANAVAPKIPENISPDNKAKSIELLVERNDIKESNDILNQQKESYDEAYHAGINEEIKANDEKIKKINEEVFNIAKEPVVEVKPNEDAFQQEDRYVVNKDENNFSFYYKLENDNTPKDENAIKEFPKTKVPFKLYRTDDYNFTKGGIADGNRPNGSKGIYFSLNKEYSNMYGKSGAKEYYLDLKNPKVITSDFSEFDYQNLTEKDIQKLKKQGYDGIVMHTPRTTVKIEGNDVSGNQELYSEVIAFDKSQVKEVKPTEIKVEDVTSKEKNEKFDTPTLKSPASNYEKLYITKNVIEEAYKNDKDNNPVFGNGNQSLNRIIERGGYSIEELNKLLPNWKELSKIEVKPTKVEPIVEQEAVLGKPKLADRLSSFKEKYSLISEGAAKAIETKRINQQAAKIVPKNIESAVLAWLSNAGNELSWKAINDAAGRREQARLNVGKDYSTEEVKIRDYAAKKRNGGMKFGDAAHKIWEELVKTTGDNTITTQAVESKLLDAIRENPTRIDASKNLINIAGAEESPIDIEQGTEDFYKRKGEQPMEVVAEEGVPESGFVPFQEEESGFEEAPFSFQEAATDEVNDMKEIVKDLIDEGVLNLNTIRNRIAKELGYDSKKLKQTINEAYQEYTKEYTPKEVTTGVIGRVGNFISDLFGGKAQDKVVILKDGQSTFAKAAQIAETGGRLEFQATLPNGEKVTAKPVDASVVNGFYSPLELQINQMKADKMPAKQWLDKLKGEEAKWTGLAGWLSQQQGSLSKQEIKDWLQNNQIEINEIVKGRAEDLTEKQVDRLKYLAKLDAENPSGAMEDIEAGSYEEFLTLLNIRDKSSSNDLINLQKKAEQNARLAQQRGNKALADKYWEDSHRYTSRHEVLDLSMEGEGGILNPTKFSDYQLEGDKKDYAEILVTLPSKTPISKKDIKFKSSHYNEADILVHLRMNIRKDAQKNKVLFLEEVQSDWGQKGREEGFQSGDLQKLETTRNLAREDVEKIDKEINEYYDKNKIKKIGLTDAEENAYANISAKMRNGIATPEEIAERQLYIEKDTYFDSQYDLAKRNNKFNELLKIKGDKLEIMRDAVLAYDEASSGQPSAPFITDTNAWTKLGLKVALKEAVKQGVDKIAWTTGEQQVGRYEDNFRKQVDKIESERYQALDRVKVIAYKNGNVVFDNVLPTDGSKAYISGRNVSLEDVVGKDIAQKIKSGEQNQNFEGNQLTIGGSGMKGFYGSASEGTLGILGNMAKSLFKQQPTLINIKTKDTEKENARINKYRDELSDIQNKLDYLGRADDIVYTDDFTGERYDINKKELEDERDKVTAIIINSENKLRNISYQYQYSINITPELKAQVEVGLPLFMANPEGDILGFKFQDKIYLNGEKLNPNTPIHEAGHIWTEWVKQNDNKVYQRGIELVKNSDYLKEVKSSKFYQEQAKKLATKEETELYFQHEALAMAIGDKGAQFVTESKRTSFKEWLDTLWTKIKNLAGFQDITAEELQNLTFEEFTKMAVKDILGKQFEGQTLQEKYETLPVGKKLRQNKEEILIRDNFDNIVAELIKNNKIEKVC
jgi:hypothetical protein